MSLGRIAEYELIEPLGRGGMGVVFKARDSRLDRVVALKVLPEHLSASREHRTRFLREARAEAGLSHASIAACYDVGEAPAEPADVLEPGSPGPHPDRLLYLAMEYVPGQDLQEIIDGPPMRIEQVLDLAIQIAAGLEAAHDAGIVHRDLKPTNVRVTPDGRIKVLDFGLARVLETAPPGMRPSSGLTSEGRVLGTAAYMAPEQANGKPADRRSDLFSFGVLLYQMITGHLPFNGATDMEVFYAAANEEPTPLTRYAANVPDELQRIVRKLLAKDPGRRYQSAHEVGTDLERLRRDPAPPIRRRPSPARAALAMGLVIAATVAGVWAWQHLSSGPRASLAVMPFRNRTGDPGMDDLGEGIAADVLGNLVRGSRINVASMSSAMAAPGNGSPETVARELGVKSVLEGTLRREGPRVLLDVALVQNGVVRWTKRYDYSLSGLLEIERDISDQVARSLAGGLAPRAVAQPHTEPRALSAYTLYLRAGAALEDADDPRAGDRALELYQKALDQDPDFALAWAGRSLALVKVWARDKTPETLRQAEEAANRAVRLSPQLLEARVARAQVYRATSRYAESIRELEAVLQVNPNWDEALLQLAWSQRDAGNLNAAEAALRKAVQLRPDYWRNWNALGALRFRRADYRGAADAFRQIVRIFPEKNRGYEQLAAVQLAQGDYAGAAATYERLPRPVQDAILASNIGSAYFYLKRFGEAERYYHLAVSLEPREPTLRINLGDLLLHMGAADSARAAYRDAVALDEALLHDDPQNPARRLHYAVALAKAGDCAGARTSLASARPGLPADDAESAHIVARVEALCGRRADAIAALRRALKLGVSPRMVRAEDEFRALTIDPEIQALMAGR